MKTFIRTLTALHDGRLLWHDLYEKEVWRKYLNSLGFYVITGTGDSLDVYAIPDEETLDKKNTSWYTKNWDIIL